MLKLIIIIIIIIIVCLSINKISHNVGQCSNFHETWYMG